MFIKHISSILQQIIPIIVRGTVSKNSQTYAFNRLFRMNRVKSTVYPLKYFPLVRMLLSHHIIYSKDLSNYLWWKGFELSFFSQNSILYFWALVGGQQFCNNFGTKLFLSLKWSVKIVFTDDLPKLNSLLTIWNIC